MIDREQMENWNDPRTPLDGRHIIAQSIEAMLGERCPDFDDACPCCAAWREFDRLTDSKRQTEDQSAVPGVYSEGQGR